jgi:MraZ protein
MRGVMDRFVSNFTNRLDAKGRVSIPASFRAVLARDGFEGLYVHPTLDAPALDAGGHGLLTEIDAFCRRCRPIRRAGFSCRRSLFGHTSRDPEVDTGGTSHPGTDSVKAHAGIADSVALWGSATRSDLGAGSLPWHLRRRA